MSAIRMNFEAPGQLQVNPKRKRGRPRKNIDMKNYQVLVGNPHIAEVNLQSLAKAVNRVNRVNRLIQQHSHDIQNPVAHFPKTERGRPPKKRGRGRPRKARHSGMAAFFPEYQKKKRKSHRGRPSVRAYWIADGYVGNKLYVTYIGQGTKNNATIEAKSLIGHKLGSKVITKVMLSGPYPLEDGRPDSSWPRL